MLPINIPLMKLYVLAPGENSLSLAMIRFSASCVFCPRGRIFFGGGVAEHIFILFGCDSVSDDKNPGQASRWKKSV